MEVRLEVTAGPSRGKSVHLREGDVVLVGRSPRCHLVIGGDDLCSRAHLLVVFHPPHCRLRDLGSLNGTFVNRQRVTEAVLNNGDRITLGRSEILVEFVQAGEAEELIFVDSEEEMQPAEEEAGVIRCARCGREQPPGAVQVPIGNGGTVYVCPECREQMRQQGEQIPGYRILRRLHRGGMGDIWEAVSVSTGERVAIKTMIPELATSRRAVRRFRREMRIAQTLQHPNIVRCLDAGEYHGLYYIVMEFVDGVDAERLRQQSGGTLPIADVVTIGLQTLDALVYAHEQGVVHRDIKPSNLMVIGRSPNYQVKVTDFGLARARGMSGLTRPGDVLGTLPFMPPEQILNAHSVDHRADIFSLGASLYHLLTGQFVFDFQPHVKDPHVTIIEDPVIPIRRRRRDIPEPLAQVIDRAIQKQVENRFHSALEMRRALEQTRNVW